MTPQTPRAALPLIAMRAGDGDRYARAERPQVSPFPGPTPHPGDRATVEGVHGEKDRTNGLALVEPTCTWAQGVARAAADDHAEAEELLRRALTGFERIGVLFELALTKERLAAVTSKRDASRLRREALTTYEQLGALPHADRLRAACARKV